jgi:hypothetical protein
MAEKNLVNETLLQIQNLEEVINENAKEILASTMKEEISELVKESMKDEAEEGVEMTEAEEDELMSMDDEESEEDESEEEESEEDESEEDESEEEEDDEYEMDDMSMDTDDEMSGMMDMDDEPVADLTGEDDFEEVFKVFKNMKNSDTVTVVPDGDFTKITDDDADVEYLLQMEGEYNEESDEFDEGWEMEEGMMTFSPDSEVSEDESYQQNGKEEVVYEIEVNDMPTDELEENEYEFELEEEFEDYEGNESYNPMMESKKVKRMSTKEGMKPKVGNGAKLGSAKKFSYKKSKGGFKEDMKYVNPTKGTGKPKFEFKEMDNMGMSGTKGETKEASRTYGMGWRKGALPKGARAGSGKARQNESVMEEVQMLRVKNEEYRKALNLFRDKLNEVAIFNSNLAYATRLFTEHSTSKQEKINILRRFDSAETLKESKALYKTIKDELSEVTVAKPIKESIERVIDREPQSGSAINLIESKTYENPQFLRMKDIMTKIVK